MPTLRDSDPLGGSLLPRVRCDPEFGIPDADRGPLPLSPAAPYASSSITLIVIVCAVAVYAFRRSLGNRPFFGRGLAAELD